MELLLVKGVCADITSAMYCTITCESNEKSFVDVYNTWTRQKWHVPNPAINKDT